MITVKLEPLGGRRVLMGCSHSLHARRLDSQSLIGFADGRCDVIRPWPPSIPSMPLLPFLLFVCCFFFQIPARYHRVIFFFFFTMVALSFHWLGIVSNRLILAVNERRFLRVIDSFHLGSSSWLESIRFDAGLPGSVDRCKWPSRSDSGPDWIG